MPVVSLDRLPLPSLQTYSSVTVALLSFALLYAYQTVSKVETITETETTGPITNPVSGNNDDVLIDPLRDALPYESKGLNLLHVLTTEVWCVWILVNTAYCCLILIGKGIQKVVFGDLRVVEKQHLRDKFWNFLFYKFIFIFGVMNVQTLEEVVLWVTWFTILGFLNLLTQISKDRFEYLSFSPTTPHYVHVKLLTLLCGILLSSCGLLIVCGLVGLHSGFTILAFMAAECLILGVRTLYVVVRYAIHLFDMSLSGMWENRSSFSYYTELIFELSILSIDFSHHLHMLLWGNIFLSMASLVLCMQIRFLFYEFQRRIKRHKNYRRVVRNMEARFPMASKEEVEQNNDSCAVCWEKMDMARKLPCGHLFHNPCLRSWLEQDTSCPTCRLSLNEGQVIDPNGNVPNERGDAPATIVQPQPANPATTNHFFHFDGSRYVSWLPSFSVEVTHTQLMPGAHRRPIQTSQLDSMARQVQSVFPHLSLSVITEDIRNTRSVDFTIENILEGRVQAAPPVTLATRAALGEPDNLSDGGSDSQMLLPGAMWSSPTDIHGEENSEPLSDFQPSSDTNMASIIDDNIPLLEEYTEKENTPALTGGRFSKSSMERESMLQERKNSMLEQAKRKYLTAHGSDDDETTESTYKEETCLSTSITPEITDEVRRRELAFQAAQRRLQSPDQS